MESIRSGLPGWLKIAALCAVVALGAAVRGAPGLEDADSGRLLLLEIGNGGLRAGTYLVFLEKNGEGLWRCRPLSGASGAIAVRPSQVRVLPFDESVPVEVVSFYAVRELSRNSLDRPALQLARELGGDRRTAAIEQFHVAARRFQTALSASSGRPTSTVPVSGASYAHSRAKSTQALPATPSATGQVELEEWKQRMENLLSGFEGFKLTSDAVAANDWLLAVALFQSTRRVVAAGVRRSGLEAAEKKSFMDRLDATAAELVAKFAAYAQTPVSRVAAFRQACPRARGVWSAAPPADFGALCEAFNGVWGAFLRLDRYSESIDFEQWGNAMLDVLLFSPDMPAFARQFDAALAAYQKKGGVK